MSPHGVHQIKNGQFSDAHQFIRSPRSRVRRSNLLPLSTGLFDLLCISIFIQPDYNMPLARKPYRLPPIIWPFIGDSTSLLKLLNDSVPDSPEDRPPYELTTEESQANIPTQLIACAESDCTFALRFESANATGDKLRKGKGCILRHTCQLAAQIAPRAIASHASQSSLANPSNETAEAASPLDTLCPPLEEEVGNELRRDVSPAYVPSSWYDAIRHAIESGQFATCKSYTMIRC